MRILKNVNFLFSDCKKISTETAIVEKMTIKNNIQLNSDLTNTKPWTRQEDMILLQSVKKEYSENSFQLISEKLDNRTVDQVMFLISLYIIIYSTFPIHLNAMTKFCCR